MNQHLTGQQTQARFFLAGEPFKEEREALEEITGMKFGAHFSRIELLSARLHLLAAAGSTEAETLLQQAETVKTRLIEWIQEQDPAPEIDGLSVDGVFDVLDHFQAERKHSALITNQTLELLHTPRTENIAQEIQILQAGIAATQQSTGGDVSTGDGTCPVQ